MVDVFTEELHKPVGSFLCYYCSIWGNTAINSTPKLTVNGRKFPLSHVKLTIGKVDSK